MKMKTLAHEYINRFITFKNSFMMVWKSFRRSFCKLVKLFQDGVKVVPKF